MEKRVKGKDVGTNLTEGSVLKALFLFMIPIVIANLIQQLYGMVDLSIIGQFTDSTGTVGVSTGGEVSDMLTPIATAFGTAGQIYIAQLVGAKNFDRAKKAIGTLLTSMLIISIAFLVLAVAGNNIILNLLNCPSEAFSQARSYLIITSIGLPFIFGYNAVCGVMRGMGESKKPLTFVIIAAIVNIILDLILVAVFSLGVAGTAIATIASQAASFFAALIYMGKNKKQFSFEFKLRYFKVNTKDFIIFMKLGLPIALKSLLVRVSMLWVNSMVNSIGLVESATNGVGNKLQKFLEVFFTSTTQASGAMVGQNLGAKRYDRAKSTIWNTLLLNGIFAVVIIALAIICPSQMFSLFNKDPEVIALGTQYMHIMIAHFICSAVVGSFQPMVIGAGASTMNFLIGVLDGVVCKVGFSLVFVNLMGMGVYGYFWGTAVSRALPSIICIIYFLGNSWQKRKLLTEEG